MCICPCHLLFSFLLCLIHSTPKSNVCTSKICFKRMSSKSVFIGSKNLLTCSEFTSIRLILSLTKFHRVFFRSSCYVEITENNYKIEKVWETQRSTVCLWEWQHKTKLTAWNLWEHLLKGHCNDSTKLKCDFPHFLFD